MSRGIPLLTLLLLAACEPPGPPPYGFDQETVQHFVFQSEERTEIPDEAPVTARRHAEFALTAEDWEGGRTELALRLKRYYLRIEGAPGGTSELALSPEGLLSRAPTSGEVRLGPDDTAPGGRPVRALTTEAVAGAVVGSDGRLLGDPWYTKEPALGDLPVVEWILMAFPVLAPAEMQSWNGRRPVPALGQYRLGIEVPIRFERAAEDRIRAAGVVQRASVELAPGYRGSLTVEHRGEATLGRFGRIEEAHVELHSRFEPEGGQEVRSVYRVRITRGNSAKTINPSPPRSDTPEG
jgi:hypothetical protein